MCTFFKLLIVVLENQSKLRHRLRAVISIAFIQNEFCYGIFLKMISTAPQYAILSTQANTKCLTRHFTNLPQICNTIKIIILRMISYPFRKHIQRRTNSPNSNNGPSNKTKREWINHIANEIEL